MRNLGGSRAAAKRISAIAQTLPGGRPGVSCSRSMVDMLLSGERQPGLRTAWAIHRLTDGVIAMMDWLANKP